MQVETFSWPKKASSKYRFMSIQCLLVGQSQSYFFLKNSSHLHAFYSKDNGNPKTEAYTILQPFGGKFSAKQNGFDAFVTFMHPSSKYSGPGTDGFLVRDFNGEINVKFIKGFQPSVQTKIIEKTKSQ